MKKLSNRLSNRETDVMNILWKADGPLTASGIAQSEEELSINTVQVVLKSLLKKSCIKVADIVYSGTVLSRAYEPVMAEAEYISAQVLDNEGLSRDLMALLLEKENDLELIEDLEELLRNRKDQIKGE